MSPKPRLEWSRDRAGNAKHSNSGYAWIEAIAGPAGLGRRAEIGHHHHVAGPYLIRYAQEAAWREDHRRTANGLQVVQAVMGLAMACPPSVDWCGYWQRAAS